MLLQAARLLLLLDSQYAFSWFRRLSSATGGQTGSLISVTALHLHKKEKVRWSCASCFKSNIISYIITLQRTHVSVDSKPCQQRAGQPSTAVVGYCCPACAAAVLLLPTQVSCLTANFKISPQVLEVTFSDGSVSKYSAELLRVCSPSAENCSTGGNVKVEMHTRMPAEAHLLLLQLPLLLIIN